MKIGKLNKFHASLLAIAFLIALNVYSYSPKIFIATERGDMVFIDYNLKLVDGRIVDSTRADVAEANNFFNPNSTYQSIRIVAGTGQLPADLDRALLGMRSGETKEVTLIPEKGFGTVRTDLFFTVPVTFFSQQGIQPRENAYVNTNFGLARIVKVSQDGIVLDLNHPLAGKTVVYEITVKNITK